MIPKIILSDSYRFGDLSVHLVPLHSRGVDSGFMRKHASHGGVLAEAISKLKPLKGRSVIHVLAVGDEESYGPNRNCDGFSRKDNVTAHRYFKDIGHVYRDHMNDDPEKNVGSVLATAHNDVMSRIELLLSLDNDKCSREVSELDRGGDIPVSMGSMQDFDVCSICGHEAPTSQQHCGHIKNMLGSVLGDGRKVYMKNPNPKYFDISLVFKPADRIAYTLRKVAAAQGQILGGHDLAEMIGVRNWSDPKTATLKALAKIYKEIPGHLRKATAPHKLEKGTVAELKKQASIHGMEHLIAFLSANGWLLGAEDFADVAGYPDPCACQGAVNAYDGISQLMDDPTQITALEEPMSISYVPLSHSAREDLEGASSMEAIPVQRRAITVTIVNPQEKVAAPLDPAESWGLSSLYNQYKLGFAHKHAGRADILRRVAASF